MTIEDYYKKLAPKLTNWLVSMGSPYAEACDLVQDTFVKIWSMRDDLQDDESAVSGLVFTIARNLRRNQIRDNKHEELVEDISAESLGARKDPTPASDVAYLRRRLDEAFAQLPPMLSEAYTLFQIGELSIKEIAYQTGVSESLVKVRIFRAKERLKELLSDLHVTF